MRLYKCSATCSTSDLFSYNTRLFWIDYPYYILHIYPSNTSKMHIRKYIQWLHDNDCAPLANIIRHMYNLGIKYKKLWAVYNLPADNYEVIDVYRYSVR